MPCAAGRGKAAAQQGMEQGLGTGEAMTGTGMETHPVLREAKQGKVTKIRMV